MTRWFCLLALIILPRFSSAWEAATTHAGLTEQSAYPSQLHRVLREGHGLPDGLNTALLITPSNAPDLFVALRRFNPVHGYTPSRSGKATALSWLVAGSVVADVPTAQAINHFLSVLPLRPGAPSPSAGWSQRWKARLEREQIPGRGLPAIDWLRATQNPMNLHGFVDQYKKSISARTREERDRHLAGAMLAAGAVLHLLQDMGSPTHVRDDRAAHLASLSRDQVDVGSRFERIAALTYGRLAVPSPTRIPEALTVASLFFSDAPLGLAQRTARTWFSANTLPQTRRLRPSATTQEAFDTVDESLVLLAPNPSRKLDWVAAQSASGGTLVNDEGVCLAQYRHAGAKLTWWIDDSCALEQIAVILPTVAGYGAAVIDRLFAANRITVVERLGSLMATMSQPSDRPATLTGYAESADGLREKIFEIPVPFGATAVGIPTPPDSAVALGLMHESHDEAGDPQLVAGYYRLTR